MTGILRVSARVLIQDHSVPKAVLSAVLILFSPRAPGFLVVLFEWYVSCFFLTQPGVRNRQFRSCDQVPMNNVSRYAAHRRGSLLQGAGVGNFLSPEAASPPPCSSRSRLRTNPSRRKPPPR